MPIVLSKYQLNAKFELMSTHTSGLIRDTEVLEVLSRAEAFANGGLGVNRIAELTNRDKGQISRVLKTLSEVGLVDRDEKTLKYTLGAQLYLMASRTKEARLATLSELRLRELVAQTQESAHLNVLRGGRVMTIKTISAARELTREGWSGFVAPAGITASGRAMLASLPDEEIKLWWYEHAQLSPLVVPKSTLPRSREPIDPEFSLQRPAKNLQTFLKMMKEVRQLGYAISDGEFQTGIVDAAAPVRDASNKVIATISTGVPKERVRDQFDSIGQLVTAAALRFSTDLGAPIVGPT